MFWKNRKHSSGGNNAQALEPLKRLSNAQVPKVLKQSSRTCQNMADLFHEY